MRAAASAALLALAQPMADGWPRWTGILGLVALVPMLTLPPQPRLRRALFWLLCGYLYGFVLVHWMWVVHWLALLLLPLLFGTSFAAFGLLDGFCRGQRERLWLGAAAWAALELLRSVGPFSFCWGLLAYGPERAGMLSVVAAMLGPYAAGYVVFLINMSVIGVIRAGSSSLRRRWIASLCVLLVFGFLSTPPAPQASPKLRALLVQGAHPQAVKWEVPPYQLLADYLRLTNQALAALSEAPDLIVWPEVAVTDVLRWRPDLRCALHGLVEDAGAPLLFGVLEADTDEADEDEIYNTLYLFSPGGGEQRYDKTHLVPWGETIPLGEALPWLKALVYSRGGGEMAAGRRLTRFQLPDGRVFGCLICFESTLPNLAARLVRGGAQFLVVATNDAWFFDTAALPQHLWAAQARALETRVPVLRAANTGITAGIDCTGRLVGRIPDQIPGTSLVEIALPTGRPLSGYALGGDGFGWLCLLACLGFVAVRSLGGRRA